MLTLHLNRQDKYKFFQNKLVTNEFLQLILVKEDFGFHLFLIIS